QPYNNNNNNNNNHLTIPEHHPNTKSNMLCKSALISALALALALVSVVSAQNTVTIIDDTKFCIFLPAPNADVKTGGTSYCTSAITNADVGLHSTFNTGFIKTKNIKTKKDYIQVTGRFDRCKHPLSIDDKGSSYDKTFPASSQCKGYNFYMQIVEPDLERYCLRCCNDEDDCPTGDGGDGCESVMGGDYDL
ncbi:hypothetical protein BGZ65_005753, partial [Modicella reniformis]